MPYEHETALTGNGHVTGVATGLAWTAAGGEILFIEATRVPGHGKLNLTGHLGDVMKESAQATLTLMQARCAPRSVGTGGRERFFRPAPGRRMPLRWLP